MRLIITLTTLAILFIYGYATVSTASNPCDRISSSFAYKICLDELPTIEGRI